jgi:hypothetical protein
MRNQIEASFRNLQPLREQYQQLIRKYVGGGYVEADEDGYGERRKKYLNMLQQAVEAYMMVLVANAPRVIASTHYDEMKPFARRLQIALNNLLEEIEFGKTAAEYVMDAMFGMGFMKIHMADSAEVIAEDDIAMDPGIPFASAISPDDFVYDTSAKRWNECNFYGDMYRVPFDSLKESGFDMDVVNQATRDESLSDRAEDISNSESTIQDEVDLADIYVPRENMIYTFVVTDRTNFTLSMDPIAEMEWFGSEKGPYRCMRFNPVPQNIRPIPPVLLWEPLDTLVNAMMLKTVAQAERSKTITTYTAPGEDAARRSQEAHDGDMVLVNDTKDVAQLKLGGIDPANQAALLQFMGLGDRMMGNLNAMLGLGASSDTVVQEKLIHGSNSRKEQAMRQVVADSMTEIIQELATLLWNDQFKVIPGEIQVPGFPDLTADATWTPEQREGKFADYKIQIDVYSMQYQGPAERAGAVKQLLSELYIPLMGILQQQSGTVDMMAMTEMLSELLNLPRLKDIVRFAQPSPQEQQGGGSGQYVSTKPNSSNRTYTRRSVSGGDPTMDPTAVAKAAAGAEA